MLVIDRVELSVLDQVANIGNLDHGEAVVLQHGMDGGDEVVRIRDMCDDVVGKHEIGGAAFRSQLLSKLPGEEPIERRMPLRTASSACSDAGSTPSTGIPCATKF